MARQAKHPDVVYTDLEDEAVLLNLETGTYYSLNEVGAAIWRLLDPAESREDLIQRLAAEYEVEKGWAESNVSEFIRELEHAQLVLPEQEGPETQVTAEEHRYYGSAGAETPPAKRKPFAKPELIKHDEPLHQVVMNPFDPQLPLAE